MIPLRDRSLCWTVIPTLLACLTVLLACFASLAAERPALIPQAVKMRIEAGHFTLTPATEVLYTKGDARLADAADYLARRLSLAFEKKVPAAPTDAVDVVPGAILLTTAGADPTLGDEGYWLAVTDNGVVIRAPRAAGAFYGGITLLQLAPPEAFRRRRWSKEGWVASKRLLRRGRLMSRISPEQRRSKNWSLPV